ncbi:MAG: cell division protein ZapA [Gammaproteobacteria bacterium]|nr:cell division protein ZapA [Gammaproteobacteria bacterium]
MKTNVSIRILENEFPLVCDISEKPILIKSAEILNNHLREFRRNNPAIDSEQLILMGALRATCEIVNQLETLSDQAKIANTEMQKAIDLLKE